MNAPEPPVLDPELEQRLRHGLNLLAARTPPPRPHRRPLLIATAAAATAVAAAGIGVAATHSGERAAPRAHPRPSAPVTATAPSVTAPPTSIGVPPIGQSVRYDLPRLVEESPRIIIGTVERVEHQPASEASGGIDYLLATVSVERTLRGPDTATVVAFDYDYGQTTSTGSGAQLREGERVLLFLADVTGTVHEQIRPQHWQVTGGAAGAYPMRGDEPDAPFTLADVQRQIAAH